MTRMEQYILDNWKEYERTCKAECKRVAKYNGHKRNSWTHERNVYYGHKRGITWNKIAQTLGTRIQNVARVLRDRGYEPNV